MGLQMISIRLPKALIDDLKYFAEREGLGYQPLIRRILVRWASHEYKLVAQERFASSMATAATGVPEAEAGVYEPEERMAACG
ncbi:hypothetical protein L599_001200000230 [Luteimonas sp. J16]|nr:hypothetical protein L599_001200000230 [Luteimonas sp. J16]